MENQESLLALTWVCVSMPLPVVFAFLVLVMLRGSSPNLKEERRFHTVNSQPRPAAEPLELLT